MTQPATYTIEQYHELFHHYLMGKFDGDVQEVDVFIDVAENVLPNTLNKYFGTNYKAIYDLQVGSDVEEYRKRIKSHTVLKNIDKSEEPRYTEVLKWYRLFVKSLQSNTPPIPVPGERAPAPVAKRQESALVHNDADYAPDSEGVERQHNLTKKERNPELRRKCIEYYKRQWGGRIHCICCGFDFGKAYGNIGEDYIEIHHLTPHHTFDGVHTVDPTTDLIPLCSNCHSMIHRVNGRGECMTLEELKEHYQGIKYNS